MCSPDPDIQSYVELENNYIKLEVISSHGKATAKNTELYFLFNLKLAHNLKVKRNWHLLVEN